VCFKIKLLTTYLFLSIKRKTGGRAVLEKGVYLQFRYRSNHIGYYLKTQLDFDVFWDSLVVDQYALPGDAQSAEAVKVIFDIGSNIGTTVLPFFYKFPQATIYAFEPDPHNFKRLSEHVALLGEGAKRVKLFNVAVTDIHNGSIPFYIGTKDHWSSSILKRSVTKDSVEVRTVNLDTVCSDEHIEKIDIMKMDIEGAEDLALDGFKKLPYVTWFMGEMHPTLMRSTIKEFINRFEGFEIVSLDTKTGVFTCKQRVT
jgi:FkbM family methyltransferase